MLGDGAIPVGPALRFGLGERFAPGGRAVDIGEPPSVAVCRAVAAVGLAAGDVQAAHKVTAATVTVTAPSIAELLRENIGTVRHSFMGERQGYGLEAAASDKTVMTAELQVNRIH